MIVADKELKEILQEWAISARYLLDACEQSPTGIPQPDVFGSFFEDVKSAVTAFVDRANKLSPDEEVHGETIDMASTLKGYKQKLDNVLRSPVSDENWSGQKQFVQYTQYIVNCLVDMCQETEIDEENILNDPYGVVGGAIMGRVEAILKHKPSELGLT